MAYRVMEWGIGNCPSGRDNSWIEDSTSKKGLSFAVKLINKSRLKFMRPPNN